MMQESDILSVVGFDGSSDDERRHSSLASNCILISLPNPILDMNSLIGSKQASIGRSIASSEIYLNLFIAFKCQGVYNTHKGLLWVLFMFWST